MKKYILLLASAFLSINAEAPKKKEIESIILNSKQNLELKPKTPQINKDYLFNKTVNFIKQHEGFRSKPYICLGGHRTIGYGFVTKYLKPEHRNFMTKNTAHNIIVNKLSKYIRLAKKEFPYINYKQSLAIAHLIYSKGLGNIKKNKLYKSLKEGNPNMDHWLYFSSYEETRSHYRKNRTYEIKLWDSKKKKI